MSEKIDKLTPEQEEYLPKFRQEYLDAAIDGRRTNRQNLQEAINDAYAVVGATPPVLIILNNPLQLLYAPVVLSNNVNNAGSDPGDDLKIQLGSQLRAQLMAQLGTHLRDQLWDDLWAHLGTQLGAQLRDYLEAQLEDQLWDQLWEQLGDQLKDQLWDDLWDQLGDQLKDQIKDQLWDQLGDQLEDQIKDQLGDQLCKVKIFGSHELYWICYAKFAEYVGVKFSADVSRRFDIMKRIGFECEWIIAFKGVCFVSQKPVKTCWDDRRRLHCEDGPAVLYEDNYTIYSWHGIRIPSDWIEKKERLTPSIAIAIKNIEQRRAACEILGWDLIIRELNAKCIDKHEDPQIGELLEVTIPDAGKERFLRVLCGTGRRFAIPVPPTMRTALQANAWTFDIPAEELDIEVRT
jgi:hypothetical protein